MSNYVRYFSGPVYIPTVSGVTLAFGRSLGTTPKTQAHVALARWGTARRRKLCALLFGAGVHSYLLGQE